MFIKSGSMVDVVAGRMAGRFGMVNKIQFDDVSQWWLIFVELFNAETGGMDMCLFCEASELKGRRYHEGELLAFMQMQHDAARPVLKAAA